MEVKAFIDGLRQGIASVVCVSPSYRALFLHQVNMLWLLVWWLLYASLCMVKHLACSLVAAAQDLLRQPVTYVWKQVEGLMRLMEGEHVGPFNLGNPGEFTMLELAQVSGFY